MIEDAEPLEAVKGSAHLVRSKWGEGLTGMISIGAWSVLAMFPVLFVGVIGFAIARHDLVPGVAVICLAAAAVVGICAMAAATRQVFAVALFRYATGVPTPGFELRDLENPFTAKKENARRRTRKWAWIALGLIAGLVLLAAIFGHRQQRQPAYSPYGSSPYVEEPSPTP